MSSSSSSMKSDTTVDRRAQIQTLLNEQGVVNSQELAERFEVSLMTIYRDLDYLQEQGVQAQDIIAIAPFRDVANELSNLPDQYAKYKGLTAGTIHTAQGREAAVVLLVLSADPEKDGAKVWAAEKVNLVNVAASRAKRRLYVVGDKDAWAQHNYFRELAEILEPEDQVPSTTQ